VLSTFSGTGAEWRPSGITRLGFPLVNWGEKRLSGSVFFAVGTEDFAQNRSRSERIRFANLRRRLRFQINAAQDVTGYASYQKRTQGPNGHKFRIELWNPFLKKLWRLGPAAFVLKAHRRG